MLSGLFDLNQLSLKARLTRFGKRVYGELRTRIAILFPYLITTEKGKIIYEKRINQRDIRFGLYSDLVKEKFGYLKGYVDYEYVLEHHGILIEPYTGWGIKNGFLLFYSVAANNWDKITAVARHPKPNRLDSLRLRQTVSISEAIYLNYFFFYANNYWHFINNFLGQLILANEHLDLTRVPVVVPNSVFHSKWFEELYRVSPFIGSIEWIPLDKCYLKISKIYFVNNLSYSKRYFELTKKTVFNFKIQKFSRRPKKVFLTRRNVKSRVLINRNEIHQIASKYDFTILDTADFSIEEQMYSFGDVTHLIGIHGAGISNLCFTEQSNVRILEVFPGDWIKGTYFLLANSYKWDYEAIIATRQENGGFYLQPGKFEVCLRTWLN
ncbi:MAG: glycosyltransferase family 61 protein [Cyclobacteriaceae bacterium]